MLTDISIECAAICGRSQRTPPGPLGRLRQCFKRPGGAAIKDRASFRCAVRSGNAVGDWARARRGAMAARTAGPCLLLIAIG
jgi:hypothetical protein